MILAILAFLVGVIAIYLMFFVVLYFKRLKVLEDYERQGITLLPGAKSFPFMNLFNTIEYESTKDSKVPTRAFFQWLLDRYLSDGTPRSHDAAKHPVVAYKLWYSE